MNWLPSESPSSSPSTVEHEISSRSVMPKVSESMSSSRIIMLSQIRSQRRWLRSWIPREKTQNTHSRVLLVLGSRSSCSTEFWYECELRISTIPSPAISTSHHSGRWQTVCRSCERIVSSPHSDSDRCNGQNLWDSESSWTEKNKSSETLISSDSRSDLGSMQLVAWIHHSQHSAGSSQASDALMSSSASSSTWTRQGNEPLRPNTNELSRV
jgi:hypothetical protein